ncbi:MAG: protein kinase, partial [Myxococcales bacterium]|nr:protein kinase [Myxococcales bacterium]
MALLDEGQLVARYEVLGRIATGGMSEVYLARQSGPGGFSKTVVLKIILPNLADDPNFVRMFGNEAKLAALLNHPNVVQIFDFGVDGAIHYMAMEYIDGRNLNHIMRALEESSQRMPIDVALRVIADACGALEYAHSLTDTDGSPLDVIHRDVSLENVLVTYGGQVKLVDFGVAKARNLESYTQVGTLKGKYAYMAPEMVEGKVLDNRADLFSMGVVMYQLFTGEPPFAGVNHAMILHQIAYEAPRAPRQVAPDLDPELERIVLRALEKRPEVRYGRAAEIQADIEHYMRRTGAALMPHQLAQFMQELFPPGTDPTRETYQKLCGTGAGLPRGEVRTGPATPAGSALGGPPRWLDDDSLATREVASIPQEDRPSSMPDVPDDFDGPTRISFGTDEGGPAHDTDPSNQWQAPSVGIDPAHADSEDASGAVATASYGARASRRQGPYNEGYEQSVNRRRRPPSSSILDQPDSRPTIVPGELRAVQRSNPSALAAPTTLEGGFEAPSSAPQIPSVAPPADTNPPSYPSNIPRTVPPSAEMMAVNVPAARPAEVPVTTIGSLPETNVAEPRRRGHRRALFFGALGLGVLLIASMVVYIVATGDGDGDEV